MFEDGNCEAKGEGKACRTQDRTTVATAARQGLHGFTPDVPGIDPVVFDQR